MYIDIYIDMKKDLVVYVADDTSCHERKLPLIELYKALKEIEKQELKKSSREVV